MSEKYKVIDSFVLALLPLPLLIGLIYLRPVYCNILDESLNYCIKERD
jgi:hypothetical protein